MKHEIRENHAEHKNGNCSSQNRAEHEIRQNHAEHENGNCSSQNHAEPKLGKIMLNTRSDKIMLNTKIGTVVSKIVLNRN